MEGNQVKVNSPHESINAMSTFDPDLASEEIAGASLRLSDEAGFSSSSSSFSSSLLLFVPLDRRVSFVSDPTLP